MRRAVLVATLLAATLVIAAVLREDWERQRLLRLPTPTPTSTATTTPAAPPGDARTIDFADAAVRTPILQHFGGGEVPKERVVYADVTGDRIDEAVAIVESGGTMGDLGAAVFEVREGKPRLLGYVTGTGRVEVRFGREVQGIIGVKQGVYAPADPRCCPTGIRETVYKWDGSTFAQISQQTVTAPPR